MIASISSWGSESIVSTGIRRAESFFPILSFKPITKLDRSERRTGERCPRAVGLFATTRYLRTRWARLESGKTGA